jgi:hypothetical protein
MGFAQQIVPRASVAAGSASVVLASSLRDASGRVAWYFVRVASPKLEAFQREIAKSVIDFTAFGEVVASGYGAHPPAHVVERMRHSYGYKG